MSLKEELKELALDPKVLIQQLNKIALGNEFKLGQKNYTMKQRVKAIEMLLTLHGLNLEKPKEDKHKDKSKGFTLNFSAKDEEV